MPALRAWAPRPLAVERCELWTDIEANRGRLIAPIAQMHSLDESVSKDGEHTVSFSVAMNHPLVWFNTDRKLSNLRIDQVVRLRLTNGTWTEHRISEDGRMNQGRGRTRRIIARSILQDLGFRGLVVRTTLDGSVTTDFQALGLELEQHWDSFIYPALVLAGQPFWELGTVELDVGAPPLDMVYKSDSPLSSCRKLAVEMGGRELRARSSAGKVQLDFLRRVGSDQPVLRVRARRNLLSMGFTLRSDDQANRVYALGAPVDEVRPTLGLAEWDVTKVATIQGVGYDLTLADPAGGPGPIKFSGQFLASIADEDVGDDDATDQHDGRDPGIYFIQYITGGSFLGQIIATNSVTQVIRVTPDPAAPPQALDEGGMLVIERVRIVASAAGRENVFLDHPLMRKRYKVRATTMDRPDIPATNNLFPNPLGRVWPDSSAAPTGWDFNPNTNIVVTRESNPRYWEHGGKAIRVRWAASGTNGLSINPLLSAYARIPIRATGYLSFFARIKTLTGKIRVRLYIEKARTDPITGLAVPGLPYQDNTIYTYVIPDSTGQLLPNDAVLPHITNIELNTSEDLGVAAAWDLTKYPLYGGTAALQISPERLNAVPAECIIEAVQLTISHEQLPLIEGNGGVRLHQAANDQLGVYATPAPVIDVNLLDLAMAQGHRFPFAPIQLGGQINIADPDADFEAETRVVRWTRDWHNRLLPSLSLANERTEITQLFSSRDQSPRHRSRLVPAGTRGLTYE